jgi:hypothetical protein
MKKIACLLTWLVLVEPLHSLYVSPQDAAAIGEKIWKNECAGTTEGLTHWKAGETFASLGIGHFIWYPVGKTERFEETFSELLAFLEKQGIELPEWLKETRGCPWRCKDEFYEDIQSGKMQQLRKLLLDTKDLQAIFIANRLERNLPCILEQCNEKERESITVNFNRLTKESRGLYALIDYLNFKGAGSSPLEQYKGEGWGLRQVLLRIPLSSQNPLDSFVKNAKIILIQRVQNAPPERNERQWLKGWLNRIDTYASSKNSIE